eukprot:Anaeramoba_flamelloidesa570872_242.p1 GENE.a570872_242~~a570872_242.p1  ORF type:complete len:350 (+),score=75.52 a570872_242:45-1094(+)
MWKRSFSVKKKTDKELCESDDDNDYSSESDYSDASLSESGSEDETINFSTKNVVNLPIRNKGVNVVNVEKEEEEGEFKKEEIDLTLFKTKFEEIVGTTDKIKYSLDLCFLVDVTSSMSSAIEAVKKRILLIIKEVKKNVSELKTRIAFVGYRDINDSERFTILDFMPAFYYKTFQKFLRSTRALGGADIPEDVMGGFEQVLNLNWQSITRLMVHIADAPCHGKRFHRTHDDFPKGNPYGLKPEVLLPKLRNKGIDYCFGSIDCKQTDVMIKLFKPMYKSKTLPRELKSHDVGVRVTSLVQVVMSAIRDSNLATGDFIEIFEKIVTKNQKQKKDKKKEKEKEEGKGEREE